MIADTSRLAELLETLADVPQVAIDTEADSLHCYFEKLCLVQVSVPGSDWLIDPLSGIDLQPFFDLLSKKRIVFHGADYDLRLLRKAGRFEMEDLFDTMIASRLCGYSELGLAALVQKFFDVTLSKASQKANWALRPLSPQMEEYAICDTKYLLTLAGILEARLRELNRWSWFVESRDRMIASTKDTKERDENKIWRVTGSAALSPRAQAALRVLWHWRDEEARTWDRPPFHVMSNEELVRIADKSTADAPFSTPRMSGKRRRNFEIALAQALQIPENEWPKIERGRRRRPSKEELDRFDALKKIRDTVAASLLLDPSIVAPRGALEAVANDPQASALMLWQRELLGLDRVETPVAS